MSPQIVTHSNTTGVILVIYPGYNGDADGYNQKYQKIAELIDEAGVAAVVRTNNQPVEGVDYTESVKNHLRDVIGYSLQNALEICGSNEPAFYLMGVSAGAGAIAAIAYEYPEVAKILLIAPSGDAGLEAIQAGLPQYTGELYVTVGADDEVVTSKVGPVFSELATQAKENKLIIVENCDHQFRGQRNGMIFSKAPLWAFAGDDSFPSPEGGIELYD